MSADVVRVSTGWLALREPADAAARATELLGALPQRTRWVVHDLACGTGSMGRWLAPRLSGAQHWVLHDHDPDLLEVAAAHPPHAPGITVETRHGDITRLPLGELGDADLITASALLDMFTARQLERLVAATAEVGCPVLLALSVTGRVQLWPADPLDAAIGAAFNRHQRRATARGALLGPDAVTAAATGFQRTGARVLVRPSPWHLDAVHAALMAEWLGGWVRAACEQQPDLAVAAGDYVDRRMDRLHTGELVVHVHHADLLVLPS